MTQKRFTMFGDMANIKQWVLDKKDNSRMSSKWEMLDKLNELAKENEQLKINNQQLNMTMSRENVRHKRFRDKVFGLIDAKIKEYQKYEKYDTEKYYIATTTLKELKKELIE